MDGGDLMEWQDGQEQKMTVEGMAGGKPYKAHCNVTAYGLTKDVVDAFNEALAAAIVKNGGVA